jgi:hypothetical protein
MHLFHRHLLPKDHLRFRQANPERERPDQGVIFSKMRTQMTSRHRKSRVSCSGAVSLLYDDDGDISKKQDEIMRVGLKTNVWIASWLRRPGFRARSVDRSSREKPKHTPLPSLSRATRIVIANCRRLLLVLWHLYFVKGIIHIIYICFPFHSILYRYVRCRTDGER